MGSVNSTSYSSGRKGKVVFDHRDLYKNWLEKITLSLIGREKNIEMNRT